MTSIKTKNISMTAMGIALFVAMTFCVQVPVFENYYLCMGYIAMVVFLYKFGVISGTIVGTVGTFLYCLLSSGMRGMPGWVVGNIIIGIGLGLTLKATKKLKPIPWYIVNTIMICISTALGILVMKSFTEMLLYSQPLIVRMGKNIYAFVADIVVLVIGLIFCKTFDKSAKQENDKINNTQQV